MNDSPDRVSSAFPPDRRSSRADSDARDTVEAALLESEARFREVANAAPVLIWLADTANKGIWYNQAWLDFTGRTLEQDLGDGWIENVHTDDRARCAEICGDAFERREPFRLDFRMRRRDGEWRVIDDRAVPRFAEDGTFLGYIGSCIDVTERRQAENLLIAQNRVLELAIQERPLAETLESLVLAVEEQAASDVVGSILLLDEDGIHLRHGAAPRLPDEYNEAINGVAIGPSVGSCGTAAHRKAPVFVSDIASDPLWADFRDLARSHGLAACWSIPILSGSGEVLGTFAMYHREPREPSRDDLELVNFVTRSAALVIERKRAEEALRHNEGRFRNVFQNAGIGLLEIDSDWKILGANASYAQIAGRSAEELVGLDCLSFTHPDDIDRSVEAMRSLSEGPTDRASFEKRYFRPDGRTVWVRSTLSRVSSGPRGDRFLKIVEDIDARKAAEEALREERHRLETLNRVWAAVAAELDVDRLVQLVTDAAVELTGAEFGAFFYNVIDAAGESYMLFTLSGADPSQFDFGMPRNTAVFAPTFEGKGVVRSDDITKDPRYGKNAPHHGMPKGHLPVRSYLAVPVVGRSDEVIGGLFFGHPEPAMFTMGHERLLTGIAAQAAVAIDNARLYQAVQRANETLEQRVHERTAELETANEALRQAQKMEAIGQLTGGIAHDFNNMLTVIRGSADVLRRPGLDEERRDKYLQAIADTSDRAARLTGQLLAFARRQALKPEVFDAAKRVESISDMLRTVLGSRISLLIDTACDDCFVETDAAQFETALVNIVVNARDAMDGEGELRISIERPDELPPSLHGAGERGCVAVSVADTGHGIAADDLDKIFEPFFTTKETGKGTGLGLSQVYGFAKQSGGEIEVDSEEGRGTCFTLYLPDAPGGNAPDEPAESHARDTHGGGRVLVVEDNEEVGQFAEQVLGELGFDAFLASSADEALLILEEDSGFDLVFSDVVMPGMGGIDLARQIRERWPGLPVVLTSGYSHVLASRTEHAFPLLHKPYSLEGLAKVIGKAVGRRAAGEPAED